MSPSTNKRFRPTTSNETTTLDLDPLNSSYVKQTELSNRIKSPPVSFDDKHAKQDENYKKSVNEIIANQDVKVDKKLEEELQTLSVQSKNISSQQGEKPSYYSHSQ